MMLRFGVQSAIDSAQGLDDNARSQINASGKLAYDAWFYMVDSGTIFRAGTTDCVAMIIQCGLECS